jgi:hypothetical protein
VYAAGGGIWIDDRAQVRNSYGGWGAVGSNPSGWLDCYDTPLTSTPGRPSLNEIGTLFGPDAKVGDVWTNDNLKLHDRDVVYGTATAEGDVIATTGASVAYNRQHTRIKMPSLNVTGMDMPTGTQCSDIMLEPDQKQTVSTACVYVPNVVVKSRATLTFPCRSEFHVGNLSTEPDGVLKFDMATGCTSAKVYVHGKLTLKGAMDSKINPETSSTSNVLIIVTSSDKVNIQSTFSGVLMAPNAFIHAVPGQKHYGAFYGRRVYLEQDTLFNYRPFNGTLPLQ